MNGNENECPECGMAFPSNFQQSSGMLNGGVGYDDGDNEAETILRNVINTLKNLLVILSIIGGVVLIIGGVAMMGSVGVEGLGPIIGGIILIILGVFFARLIWALCMLFINISTNVRNIKHMLKNK